MTAGCYYLVLIDVASAADMSACGILGGIDDTVHMFTYVSGN